ncbi:MAG: hypothetical protein ACOX3A_07165 [bacterium]|jgi:hypothetical protein
MCFYAGMQMAVARAMPVIDLVYRDRLAHLNKLDYNNPEKAHLYY